MLSMHPSEVHQHKDSHCHWLACRQLTVCLGHDHQAALLQPCDADCLHGSQTLRPDHLVRTWPHRKVLLVGLTGRQTVTPSPACLSHMLPVVCRVGRGTGSSATASAKRCSCIEGPSSGSGDACKDGRDPTCNFSRCLSLRGPSWKLTRRCLPLSITWNACLLEQLCKSLVRPSGLCQ